MKLVITISALSLFIAWVSSVETRLSKLQEQQVQIQSDTTYMPIYGFKNKKWGVVDTSMTIKTNAVILTKAK